jgi:GTP-binding protein
MLGLLRLPQRDVVLADIPGIIEGASRGRGLGLKFLRHIERTRLLVYLLPADAGMFVEAYAVLRREVEAFSPALAAKPHVVAISKTDLVRAVSPADLLGLPDGVPVFTISSRSRQGLEHFLGALWQRLAEVRREAEAAPGVGRTEHDTSEAPPARSGPGTGNTAT